MGRRRALEAEQERQICLRYQDGQTVRKLGQDFEISHQLVCNIIRRHGGTLRPRSQPRVTPDGHQRLICFRYAAGDSARDLARDFGVTTTTIYNVIRANGGRTRQSQKV